MTGDGTGEAYWEAAGFFLRTAELIRSEQWAAPGLGSWTVRDLVGHASRSLWTPVAYLDQPAERVEAAAPEDYFVAALARGGPDVHQDVAERGREAGAALGDDPVGRLQEMMDQAEKKLATAGPEQVLSTPGGGMRLGDYLGTRVFELTIHTVDLAEAIGVPTELPPNAGRICLEIIARLALRRGRGGDAIRALTGRAALPPGFTVL